MKKILLLAATIFCFSNLINAQAGRLDPSFGTNGIVATNLGKPYLYNGPPAYQILPQADGSMYVTEGFTLTKRRSNGSVDSSFHINLNFNGTNLMLKKAAVQSNGKIVVIGLLDDSTKYDPSTDLYASALALARYKPDGSTDSSFSKDGLQTTSFGVYNDAYSVVIQKNGKIIAAGSSESKLALARYNTDGSPDKTFDGDGKLTTNAAAGAFASLAVEAGGKIVIAGTLYTTYDPNSGRYLSDFAVVQFNTDGSLDKTFSDDGIQTTDFGSGFNVAEAAAIQSDGKIIVGGYFVQNYMGIYALARYNTDGSLDKGFSGDGKQMTEFGPSSAAGIYAIAIQPDGKIVVGGDGLNVNNGHVNYFTVARYRNDGSLDKSFSGDGKILEFGYGDTEAKAYTIAIQNNGKIVAGGLFNSRTAFARYNTDGSPDNTFDKDGKLIDGFHSGNTIFNSTAVQKDGKAVAVGRTWNGSNFDFAVVRYNLNGSLDNTFSSDGTKTTDFGSGDDYARSVAIQKDGKIVVAGYSSILNYDNLIFSIVRYNTDGSLDNTFNHSGKLRDSFGSEVNSVAVQSDGKIVVVGSAQVKDAHDDYHSNFAVARYNADGTTDKTFNKNGKVTYSVDYDGEVVDCYATSVAVQSNGKIIVAGLIPGYNAQSFSIIVDGDGSIDQKGLDNTVEAYSCSVAVQKDDKIVMETGYDYRGNGGIEVRRYNSDLSADSSFHGKVTEFEFRSDIRLSSIDVQNDGKIVIAGSDLFRYNSDGSTDGTFGTNGTEKAAFSINDIAIANNKLYAAGGKYSGLVARYLLDNNNTSPTVTLTSPANNATYLAPAAHIKLSAAASDKDGTITKVEFYNGTTLLHTETVIPYGYVWRNVGLGNYTLTAKAYDNSGNVTTSAPVHISVVPNKAPIVSITSPANNQTFADTATIHFKAAASDTDGRITNVKFYNGTTLLRTEFKLPYTYNWENVAAGTHTITAVATDNWGAHTTSAPVTITVTSARAMIVSSKPYSKNGKTTSKDALRLSLAPNPATNIINLFMSGLKPNKPADISIISISGIVLKKVQTNGAAQMQLDVSSLAKGVYTIKIASGEKVMYKQFVKL